MDSYMIRVYRRAPNDPKAITGTVETAGITGEQPFAGLEKLCNILLAGPPGSPSQHLVPPSSRTDLVARPRRRKTKGNQS